MAPTLKRSFSDEVSPNKKLKQTQRPKKGILSPASNSNGNVSMVDASPDNDTCPLEVEPSAEFTKKTVFATSFPEVENSSAKKGKKRSFKRISAGASPLIPLNDDCTELVEHDTLDKEPTDKSVNKSSHAEQDQEISILNSMSLDEMQEHMKRCIQLSSENKINSKNAFALKLIDCMSIVSKNDDENNFAAMACQLDAGAKIYSHRVDAVHQDVMKLVETCLLAETRTKKKKGDSEPHSDEDDEQADPANAKDRTKKRKKKVLATSDQITRQPKQTDPREQFVRLEALPGDILNKAKRNPVDLSLTLDRHTPYWMIYEAPPTHATGLDEISTIAVINRKLGPDLDLECKVDVSTLPKIEKIEHRDTSQDIENDWDADVDDDFNKMESEEEFKECLEKEGKRENPELICDADMITLAKSRMTEEGSNNSLSRVDVMKALFHKEGESEYHYLKMQNSLYWAGPSYWKRPQGVRHLENKKKTVRKKKEPLIIEYTSQNGKITLKHEGKKNGIYSNKRTTRLSKRTLQKWSKKKVTCPIDIHFNPQRLIMLYHVEIVVSKTVENQPDNNPPSGIVPLEGVDENDPQNADDGSEGEGEDLAAELNMDVSSDSPEENVDMSTEQGHDSQEQQENVSGPAPPDVQEEATSSSLDTAPFAGFGVAGPSVDNEGPVGEASNCDVYEGDNLVPMVKTVKVNPIRCVARPQRIDMAHLKAVMLDIILNSINACEQTMRDSGESRLNGYVLLTDVYRKLRESDQLLSPTRDDLTFQIMFFCLLALTNENEFFLKNDKNGDVIIKKNPDEEDLADDAPLSFPNIP